MVCIYCGHATGVVNSRPQKRTNSIWRRRACVSCGALFTTTEQPDLAHTLMVEHDPSTTELLPFNRDQLFVSVLACCKHRPTALQDATSLTATIIQRLVLDPAHTGLVTKPAIIRQTHGLLKQFDEVAATLYKAYHPLS